MSFGGGGFGGFGQNNNNNTNQSSGFGGFGAGNTNTNTGFGASNNTGFGSNTGGGMFGQNTNTNTASSGFGSGGGGFGSNTGGGFGSKPAFGAPASTTGGGMFGGANTNTTSSGFGGFGSSNTNTSSPFGGATNTTSGGGLFGGNKTGFGASTSNTGSSLFGGGGANTNTTGGFGSSSGFGASNTGMGAAGDAPGTAVAPFQAWTEKEANSTVQNAFQNILFQEPYKKFSGEELRLADYTQGRRHGNAGGGAGAFGVSSGFGGGFGANNQQQQQQQTTTGFGGAATNTGGGLFGANNNTNTTTGTGFGQTGNTGFGANTNTTGGGLFGQTKPAGGGLFGGGNNTQTQQTTGGGMFGSGNTGFGSNTGTTGGFGSSTTNTGGGGLFGGNNQNKPAGTGFGFGNTNTTNTTSGFGGASNTGFGANTNTGTGGGLFGNTGNTQQASGTGGGLFGSQQPQQQQSTTSGFGGFGQQNNQNQTQQSGGGLFGNQAAKPATGGGLFGSSTTTANTGGGLFGGANTTQQSTSGFGGGASTGGGLFGAAKPATGTGLFGGSTNAQSGSTGGGLFGGLGSNNQQQQQQNTGGGLFGSANANQQKPGGLFGSSTQATGTGMFGSQNQQNQGSSLFGGAGQQQNQQGGGLGGSLLGNSQQNASMPQGLTANLNDVSAYGTPALFAGLSGNETPNPGPLATPLNGNSKPRKSSILPMYKLAPASASRFATPQKRGFGFSYSSYGTPGGSPASISSTPGGLGRSLLGSSGSLSKSMSTNNLRRQFNTEDSILAPGAFSSSSNTRWYGSTGSKKLIINREIRSDLFTTPQKDRQDGENGTGRKLNKRVSFDTSNVDSDETTTPIRALPAAEDSPSTQAEDTPRQNKSTSSNGNKTPEVDQPTGKELAIVQEEDNSQPAESYATTGFDNAPGQYWMQPSKDELQSMNRIQRQKIDGFTVGRDNVGYIKFKVPVDISAIDLDDICGGIVQLEPRSATVYPIAAKKPPVGKGLNVPSRISLEQSWPRGGRDKRVTSDPKRFNKHIERLKRITDTTFESYDKDSGVWTFSVEHFTTYGLDDSDEETDAEMEGNTASQIPEDDEMGLGEEAEMLAEDDAFNFQHRSGLPGAFDAQDELLAPQQKSFLGVSSADSAPADVRLSLEDHGIDEEGDEYDLSEDEDMARSLVGQHHAAELEEASSEGGQDIKRETPGGILRARMRAVKDSAGPVRLEVADGDDWAEMLRKTVSPIKRDRQLLRELNESPSRRTGNDTDLANEDDLGKSSVWGRRSVTRPDKTDVFAASTMGQDKSRGFATSIDLMNSLFEKPKPTRENLRASQSAKGFPKWPYQRQDKALADDSDRAFHTAPRATWGPDETLVVTRPLDSVQSRPNPRDLSDIITFQRSGIQTDSQDLRLAKFSTQSSKKYLRSQDKLTDIRLVEGVPFATVRSACLKELFHHEDMNDASSIHEKRVWELASILFDDLKTPGSKSSEQVARKKLLSEFWTDLVDQASSTAIGLAGSSEEKAVACLAGHRITDACKHLLDGKNFRIGTLVSLIGTSDSAKKDMKEQLKAWQDSKMLSEFTEAIRTIYEMLSGNVCVCEGMKGVPVEDRLDSFVISTKFGLDWRQSFGLRLWYALDTQDDARTAVEKFKSDVDQDREVVPMPWYVEQGLTPLWDDAGSSQRQDLLWGLLQLYADKDADLEAILRLENSQLSPLDVRVCWQLGQALVSTGKVSYGRNEAVKMDAVTVAYAAQLTSAGDWLEAIFVLLHLQDKSARKQAIQEQICRHAGLIGPDNGPNFTILTEKLLIPADWLWEALALYMRSVKKDASAEVQCLLRASSFEEAHRVLVNQVAPQMVIERNYAGLSALISQFQGHQDTMAQWSMGGEIYSHFLQLVQHRSKNESIPSALLERLLAGLNAMSESSSDKDIVRYAAVADMADETAREILKMAQKKQDMELRSRILHLPLTQDRLLAYSLDLGLDRYREVMTH